MITPMKTFVFTMVTVLLLAKSSFARIGDTEAVIGRRYGKSLKTIAEKDALGISKVYHANGYFINVTYMDGKSVCEHFIKDRNARWSDAEIIQLLDANKDATQHWERPKNLIYMFTKWVRSDHKVEASFALPGVVLQGALMIETKDYSDAVYARYWGKPPRKD
jgi:hypothetical protein